MAALPPVQSSTKMIFSENDMNKLSHIRLLAVALMTLSGAPASHAETTLWLDSGTWHRGNCVGMQRCANSARVGVQFGSWEIGAGNNSYKRTAFHAGGMWNLLGSEGTTFRAGVWAAVSSGYGKSELRTNPFLGGLHATWAPENSSTRLQLLYVPAVGEGTTAVLQARFGIRF